MGPHTLRVNLNALLRHDVFSVDQLSSTDQSSKAERLGQSFYNMVDYVAGRIAEQAEIRASSGSMSDAVTGHPGPEKEHSMRLRRCDASDRVLGWTVESGSALLITKIEHGSFRDADRSMFQSI